MSERASMRFPWYLRGKVIHGHGRGGLKLGFPTANIQLDDATREALMPYYNQVLYGWGCIEEKEEEGHNDENNEKRSEGKGPLAFAMSVGFNPQFKDKALSAEVHFLYKFTNDFYDRIVRIVVLGPIREQGDFTTLEALIKTIEGDVRNTKVNLGKDVNAAFEKDRFVLPDAELTMEEKEKLPYFKVSV